MLVTREEFLRAYPYAIPQEKLSGLFKDSWLISPAPVE